ncbi:hypothetical protein [Halegenticoccus tardaugens]|uniref:hypothetical protein n=1 Tax=Halegenticoccus tardaugens TaxID=2071624 RepID=UPI00100ACBB3|nr:hypothetical protein [Halegenticoccus tardaugens]
MEVLLAYLLDEPRVDVAESWFTRIDRRYVSYVTLTEVTYVGYRHARVTTVDDFVRRLREYGIRPVDCAEVWHDTAFFKGEYSVTLGTRSPWQPRSKRRRRFLSGRTTISKG